MNRKGQGKVQKTRKGKKMMYRVRIANENDFSNEKIWDGDSIPDCIEADSETEAIELGRDYLIEQSRQISDMTYEEAKEYWNHYLFDATLVENGK